MSIFTELHALGQAAREASRCLATLSTEQKNCALLAMAEEVGVSEKEILAANEKDLQAGREKKISAPLLDRLTLTPARLQEIVKSIHQAASLPDPVGKILSEWKREDDLFFQKVSVPLGVIGIIYESRPNVTVDAAILCLKAGNACLLRGGSEAFETNMALAAALQRALKKSQLPKASIQLVPTTDRAAIQVLCEMEQYLDCLIPRGGKGLIETVVAHARMPVIKHYDGVCAAYIDEEANLEMATELVFNGKYQRPSACNSLETILLHEKIAAPFLKIAGKKLLEEGIELRCSSELLLLFSETLKKNFSQQIKTASEDDFRTEFLALTLALKTVTSLEEAIDHIETHGSHHSDLIVTENQKTAEQFLHEVDSATVYWNASTRFTDGGEFGFGAEIGISTGKFHARGPMGLAELTSYKYLIRGNGQVRH
ncbi:MAG: glutamate-5-semialdehyde dehydrogenase [Verrucomicrobia bacterium]|nr:glutamate-5-semialdehyde dehydrogenase [Verrucomicrobiota bacterium]